MSDEFVPRRKMFKKKRKHEGQNWDQSDVIEDLERAKRKGRVHCRTCKRFVPWKELDAQYEKVSKKLLQQVWYHRDCGNAVHTLDIDLRKKAKKKEDTSP